MAAGIKVTNIEKMREAYARGDDVRVIATQFGCHRHTVTRYCRNIERPEPNPPLTADAIDRLLRGWPRVAAHG